MVQRVVQRLTANDNDWSFRLNPFFRKKEVPIIKHPKEGPSEQAPKKAVVYKRQGCTDLRNPVMNRV